MKNNIKDLLEELIALRMNKGVTPWELAENIATKDYSEISSKNTDSGTECRVIFHDTEIFGDIKKKYQYLYKYDKDMILNEMYFIKKGKRALEWSRKQDESRLIDQIIQSMDESSSSYDIDSFITSLPHDLRILATDINSRAS